MPEASTGAPPARGRILCVTSNFPRWEGDSTTPFVLDLARSMTDLGWLVDVLAPHAPGCARVETMGGVRVERFRYLWPASLQTVCYQGGALINLRRRPANFLKLPALVLAEWLAVVRRLWSGRYDLLHSHWLLPQGFVGVLAARLLRVPHVVTVHGGDVFALRGHLLGSFKRFALRGASAVTVNSSSTEGEVALLGAGSTPVRRIPMGVAPVPAERDRPAVRELRERHRRGEGPLLLFVGRLVEEKGVRDLLDAVSLLRDRSADVTALVVGDGQDRQDLESHARRAGLDGRVTFTGWVPPASVADYMEAADVFVGPSRTSRDGWKEAQGLTFLEAMACGTPVVATRCGGIADAVRDGETGLLVPEGAPAALAEAVLAIRSDPELARRLSLAGAALVAATYSRRACAEAFDELFRSLVPHPQGVRT